MSPPFFNTLFVSIIAIQYSPIQTYFNERIPKPYTRNTMNISSVFSIIFFFTYTSAVFVCSLIRILYNQRRSTSFAHYFCANVFFRINQYKFWGGCGIICQFISNLWIFIFFYDNLHCLIVSPKYDKIFFKLRYGTWT